MESHGPVSAESNAWMKGGGVPGQRDGRQRGIPAACRSFPLLPCFCPWGALLPVSVS